MLFKLNTVVVSVIIILVGGYAHRLFCPHAGHEFHSAVLTPCAVNTAAAAIRTAVTHHNFCRRCQTSPSDRTIHVSLVKENWLGAGHEFHGVGLTPCALNTAAAAIGTKFTITFTVSDSSSPPLQATVSRTVVVVSPCSSGMSLLRSLHVIFRVHGDIEGSW